MKIKDHNCMEFYNTIIVNIRITRPLKLNFEVTSRWAKCEIVSLVNWYQKRVHKVINVTRLIIYRLKHRARQEPMPINRV